MYAIVPLVNGELDLDYRDLIQAIGINDNQAIVFLREGAEIRESWRDATETDWQTALARLPQPTPPPDTTQILGQFIVQQTLKNAELEQKLDAIGTSTVQILMK